MKAICHDCKYLGEVEPCNPVAAKHHLGIESKEQLNEYYLQCNFPLPMVIVPFCSTTCRYITRKMVNEADQWPALQHCEVYEKKQNG